MGRDGLHQHETDVRPTGETERNAAPCGFMYRVQDDETAEPHARRLNTGEAVNRGVAVARHDSLTRHATDCALRSRTFPMAVRRHAPQPNTPPRVRVPDDAPTTVERQMDGLQLPTMNVSPPGPMARAWVERLARVECPAITARRHERAKDGGRDPIVWAEARGSNVRDVDGNIYVDLSSAFAVAGVGHAHPRVVEAARTQSERLIHAMGDLFPSREKILLGEKLAALTPGDLQHSILGMSGSDAVEAAIKTAMIATGRSRVLAFHGGYHGMSLGALGVSGYRDAFRAPFRGMAGAQELRLPYATCSACPLGHTYPSCELACMSFVERVLTGDAFGSEDIAAVIVEPIQGRAGDIVPPLGWLPRLREVTEQLGICLIFDEIYTGFGRTGAWFACEHEGVVPDLLVVGKGMGGGFPISAAIGRASVMETWEASKGEAIHTSTFLGNPLGCAMAIAAIEAMEEEDLVARSRDLGTRAKARLTDGLAECARVAEVRGRGLMLGVALLDTKGRPWGGGGVHAMHAMLERGFLVSPGGVAGDVVSLAPPFVISEEQLDAGVDALVAWVRSLPGGGT